MRACIVALLLAGALSSQLHATEVLQDVVHLKNGSTIRGTVVEFVPGASVKIETADGSIFVYAMGDVDRITKEAPIRLVEAQPQVEKSPGVALFLSFVFPGLGQHYNGDHQKGIVHGVIAVAGVGMALGPGIQGSWREPEGTTKWYAAGLLTLVAVELWSVVDAATSAERINREAREREFGHLMEFQSDRYVIGVDVGLSSAGPSGGLVVHF